MGSEMCRVRARDVHNKIETSTLKRRQEGKQKKEQKWLEIRTKELSTNS